MRPSSHLRRLDQPLANSHLASSERLLDRSDLHTLLPERMRDHYDWDRIDADWFDNAYTAEALSQASARARGALARTVGSLRRDERSLRTRFGAGRSTASQTPTAENMSGVINLLEMHVKNLELDAMDEAVDSALTAEEKRALISELRAGVASPAYRSDWSGQYEASVDFDADEAPCIHGVHRDWAASRATRPLSFMSATQPAHAALTLVMEDQLSGDSDEALLTRSALDEALDLAEGAEEGVRPAELFPAQRWEPVNGAPEDFNAWTDAADQTTWLQDDAEAAVREQLAHVEALPGLWSDQEPGRGDGTPTRVDVHGNEVENLYPRLASARHAVHQPDTADGAPEGGYARWAEVPEPAGLSQRQRLQFEQERLELSATDKAVDEFKLKLTGWGASTGAREGRRLSKPGHESVRRRDAAADARAKDEKLQELTPAELLGKMTVKRRILKYQWHSSLASQIRNDMVAAVLGSPADRAELKREGVPPALLLQLATQTAPSLRAVALETLSVWHPKASERAAAGKSSCTAEEIAGAEATARERLLDLPASAGPSAVMSALRSGFGKGRRDETSKLLSTYESRLGRLLGNKADVLAALSLQVVLLQALKSADPHGVRATRLCTQLGGDVRLHFWREAIYLHERDAMEVRAREARQRLADAGDKMSEEERLETRRNARMPHELLTWLQDMSARETSLAIRKRRQPVSGVTKASAAAGRPDATSSSETRPDATFEDGLADLGEAWSDADKVRIGAYLVSRMIRNALFDTNTEPRVEDGARSARNSRALLDGASCRAAACAQDSWELNAMTSGAKSVSGSEPGLSAQLTNGETDVECMLALASATTPDASSSFTALEQTPGGIQTDQQTSTRWEKALRHIIVHPSPGRGRGRATAVGYISLDRALVKAFLGDPSVLRHQVAPDQAPMLAPPIAWSKEPGAPPHGGFMHQPSMLMRTFSPLARQRLADAPPEQLQPVFDGLNACAATSWRIHHRVLEVVEAISSEYPDGLGVLPSAIDEPLPPQPPDATPEVDASAFRAWRRDLRRANQRNGELYSLRCGLALKLGVARAYRDRSFYFAYNLDFRGRAYPMSPYLSPVGDDLARGLLRYSEARRVGVSGLRWLKIHAASLYGQDKLPLDERVAWTDEQLASGRIAALAAAPLVHENRNWWLAADNPMQFFAVICDLAAAHQLSRPEEHLSDIPVAQDGSCNGLQHYAALGRDSRGGQHVNLLPGDRPGDVYSGVLDVVRRKVQEDTQSADETVRALAAQLDGRLTRKVVKQTVMTTVYGVTFVGARDQIERRLRELPELKAEIADDRRFTELATYCARLTLASLGEVFEPAMVAMDWLAHGARIIGKDSQAPVEWTTPLGLPVVQPYHKPLNKPIKTILQCMNLADSADPSQPADVRRQVMALPPNYVHSLDSSHMLMTASACRQEGIAFAAVHDSYWSHACDVDKMNAILREQFVALHKPNLLEKLYDEWRARYTCCRGEGAACADFNRVDMKGPERCSTPGCQRVRWDDSRSRALLAMPARGDLNIDVVKESTYFFA